MNNKKIKIAFLISHPIQVYASFFRSLGSHPEIDLTVYFCIKWGAEKFFDPEFAQTYKWDIPIVEGYKHVFLKNYSLRPSNKFFGQINPGIIGELRREKYDAVIIHGYTSVTNWFAFFGAFIGGIPIFFRGISHVLDDKPGYIRALKRIILPLLFKMCAACLYIGKSNRDYYEQYGVPEEKLFFVPHIVDNEFFRSFYGKLKSERKKIRQSFGFGDDHPVLLFVGKLIPKKRPLMLLEAYEKIRKEHSCGLMFAGDGQLRKEIEDSVRKNNIPDVVITGFLNQTELPKAYVSGDILALPSVTGETWGLVVNEGMNFDLPVVVSDKVGCAPDLVRENENGFIFSSPEELRDSLLKLVLDKEMRARFGKKSGEVISAWGIPECVENMVKALHSVDKEYGIKKITRGPKHHFFGFYDICPWDISGRYLLSHEVDFIDRKPKAGEKAVIGFVDLEKDNLFTPIGETGAWNFQQGARFQWLPGADSKVVYNDSIKNDFVAVVADIKSLERKILPKPIYAIHPSGRFGLGLNFARLERLGGYGYVGGRDQYASERYPENDGIYRIDLDSGHSELIVSIKQMADYKSNAPVNQETDHFLTHPVFNPSGNRFCFLHRFSLKDGGLGTRLFTANSDGSDLYCVAEGILSHFDWLDDWKIMIWGRHNPFLTKVRQMNFFALPIFKSVVAFVRKQRQGFIRNSILGDQLLVFTDKSGEAGKIGAGVIKNDGHFTRLRGKDWILGDAYADESHNRKLFIYNMKENRKVDIGNFYALPDKQYLAGYRSNEPWGVSEMRSDLHPRWSRDGTQICIDSVHEGSRQIYVLDAGNLIDRG